MTTKRSAPAGPTKSKAAACCAYCGGQGPLTKEHIIPRFLYRQFPQQKLGYNARADKFMKWEAQVRDVCAACNNGPLSQLDLYAQQFFSSINCERTYTSRERIEIEYNYEQLVRWLLKVSYNSSRALSDPHRLLRESAAFISGTGTGPPLAFLAIEVVQDTPLTAETRRELPEEVRHWRHIPSRMFRVGPARLHEPSANYSPPEHCSRFVAVNAWYFTFCVVDPHASRAARRRLAASFQAFMPNAVELKPHHHDAVITVSRRTGLEAYAFQGAQVRQQWTEYLRQTLSDPMV